MKTRCSTRAFTLIEVLVVMAIVAIATSALGVAGKRAFDRYRVESSCQKVVARLNLATQLMVCCNAEITLTFEEGALLLDSTEPLPEGYVNLLDKPVKLPGIHSMTPSTLTLSPRRRDLLPSGTLQLNDREIELPGYPRRIA